LGFDPVAEIQIADVGDATDEATEQALAKMDEHGSKEKKPMCDTQAYIIKSEAEVKDMGQDFLSLKYGSAEMGGYLYQDKVCIDPIGNRCANDFQFIALSKA
jgi:hypothetical protein